MAHGEGSVIVTNVDFTLKLPLLAIATFCSPGVVIVIVTVVVTVIVIAVIVVKD